MDRVEKHFAALCARQTQRVGGSAGLDCGGAFLASSTTFCSYQNGSSRGFCRQRPPGSNDDNLSACFAPTKCHLYSARCAPLQFNSLQAGEFESVIMPSLAELGRKVTGHAEERTNDYQSFTHNSRENANNGAQVAPRLFRRAFVGWARYWRCRCWRLRWLNQVRVELENILS